MKRSLAGLIFVGALGLCPGQAETIKAVVQSTIFPLLDGTITEVALSSNGALVAITSSGNNVVKVFSTKSGTTAPIATLKHATPKAVSSLAFSPNGQLIAAGNWDGKLRVWKLPSGEENFGRDFDDSITSVRFSSDNETVAVGTANGAVVLWNTKADSSRIVRGGKKFDRPVRRLRFVSDGNLLMWATAHAIYRYNFLSSKLEETDATKFPDYSETNWSPSPDGMFFAYSGRTFRLWQMSEKPQQVAEVVPLVDGKEEPISAINFFETESRLTVGYGHRTIAIWDMVDVLSSNVLPVKGIIFDREALSYFTSTPNGEILATGNEFDGYVEIWRVRLLPR